jgi:GntR family transcriptional regulator
MARKKEGSVAPPASGRAQEPLYIQLAKTLKDEIVSGIFPLGSQLPTEDELSVRFSVSRHTVREAIRLLREEELVASRQGAGTVVIPPKATNSYVLHATSINDLVAYAHGTNFKINVISMVTIDAKQSARIGLPAGEEWLAVQGIRHAEGEDIPFCMTEYYINRSYAAVARLLHRQSAPIFPLIEDLFAVTIAEVYQEISADFISPEMSEALQVAPETVGLQVRRTYRITDGTIAQVTISTHPASRFRHSMTMRRVKA